MRRDLLVIAVGWGLFCAVGNSARVTSTVVQMAVPWVWVAAYAGYRAAVGPVRTALLGGVTLTVANVSYFATSLAGSFFAAGVVSGGIRFFVLWTCVALVAGPAAAVIGRSLHDLRRATPAAAALSAVSVAEPLALWPHIDHLDAHITYVIVAVAGLALPVLLLRSSRRMALGAVALTLAAFYPLAVTLEWFLILLGQVSAPMRLV